MAFHSFVLTLDATQTDAQMTTAINSFMTTNGILDTNIKTMAISRAALRGERIVIVITAAI